MRKTQDVPGDIAFSWKRSEMAGIERDAPPTFARHAFSRDGGLIRAARPVLDRACVEFDAAPLAFVIADPSARLLDIRQSHRALGAALARTGIEVGIRMAEDEIGTNAVGTVLEARRPLLVHGLDHYKSAFHGFSCYGYPIINPTTRRLDGVLNVGGSAEEDFRYFAPIAQRLVREIEERLVIGTPTAQRRLLAAFHTATRRKERPVMVVGEGLVLATPRALDLLDPADQAAIRSIAEATAGSTQKRTFTLQSGRDIEFTCSAVEGGNGVVIEFTVDRAEVKTTPSTAPGDVEGWPVLVVGEAGTGRTTEALHLAGRQATLIDAADIAETGEHLWAVRYAHEMQQTGTPLVVENVQCLTESMATLAARLLRGTQRKVVLTSTSADVPGIHPSLLCLCADRRELVPLRRRRHEIPRLAKHMLDSEGVAADVRLTTTTMQLLAAQSWPGNLSELNRVVRAAARSRSAGDIIPSDLPAPYREAAVALPPIRNAEREVIMAAIEAAGGNKVKAAQSLGVSRSTLYNRLRILKIA